MKKQMFILSFVGFVGVMFLSGANAAPTVKKLGATNNALRTNNTAVMKASADSAVLPRSASVRMNNTKTIKTSVVPTKTITPSDSDAKESRLSVGKYLHGGTGSSKGTVSVMPSTASNDLVELKDRVTKNEDDIDTISKDIENHIQDADAHVSADDRERWDAKQDALTAGEGIAIEDGVINSVMKIPVGSENAPRTASIWVE